MYTGDDLADTCLNAALVSDVGNVLAALANDNTGFLGRDKCTKS